MAKILEKSEDLFRDTPKRSNKLLKVVLPIPPSVNSMYINTRRGGRTLTRKAQDYIRDSKALINLAIEEQNWVKHSKHTWLYLDIVVYMPDRKIRDSHNMLKILLDVMQGTVYDNDYYVMPRIQAVELDKKNPRIEVCVHAQTKNSREKGIRSTM